MLSLWIELKHLHDKDLCSAKERIFQELVLSHRTLSLLYSVAQLPILKNFSVLVFFIFHSCLLYKKGQGSLCFPKAKNEFKRVPPSYEGAIIHKGFRSLLSPISFFYSLGRSIRLLPRILRYTNKIQSIPFYCILRSVELIAYYHFLNNLEDSFERVIVTTDGNPNGLALLAFAKKRKIAIQFFSHALPAPPYYQGYLGTVHPVDSLSQKIYAHYFKTKEVKDPSIEIKEKELSTNVEKETVTAILLCLSKSDDLSRLEELHKEITLRFPKASIKNRLHPYQAKNYTDLKEDLKGCQLAVISNSGVFVDLAALGIPCLYCDTLDPGFYDRYGFIKMGLLKDLRDY